jgi:putative membrane protein
MNTTIFSRLALALFCIYCVVFPGSVTTLALDAVPAWGAWMGPALLVVQGLAVISWALGTYGRRGGLAVAGALLLAWAVEHIGEITGFPFGRYRYTELLQPQIGGVVPAPITLAWLMAAFGSWQLASAALGARRYQRGGWALPALTGALVVALDLQIETVATLVNPYWEWLDAGPYYGVPLANFAAWFAVGALMALIVELALGDGGRWTVDGGRWTVDPASAPEAPVYGLRSTVYGLPSLVLPRLPALLYVLSSLMFTVVNFARGYSLAGLVGMALLGTIAAAAARKRRRGG